MTQGQGVEAGDGPDWERLFDALEAIEALVVHDEEAAPPEPTP
jgi:hypothetical protein